MGTEDEGCVCGAPCRREDAATLQGTLALLLREQHNALIDRLDVWMQMQEMRLTSIVSRRSSQLAPQRFSRTASPESSDACLQEQQRGQPQASTSRRNGTTATRRESDLRRYQFESKAQQSERRTSTKGILEKVKVMNKSDESVDATTSVTRWLTTHPAFEGYFAFLIVANAFYIGFELQMSIAEAPDNLPALYTWVGHIFTLSFLVEFVLRLIAEKKEFFVGENVSWNLFDAFLVATSMLELAVDIYAVGLAEYGSSNSNPNLLSNMRLIRIIRASRLIKVLRIAKLLRFVRALSLLVFSILTTLRSLAWATVLMALIMYFFAIVVCQGVLDYLVEQCLDSSCKYGPELRLYWGSVPRGVLTLFQTISGGRDWDDFTRPLEAVDPVLSATVLIFIVFAQFAVLNVVTGVFCQAALEGAQKDRELMVQSLLSNREMFINTIGDQFAKMFTTFGGDEEEGGLTLEGFEEHLKTKAVREYFALLDLDVSDAWILFKLLDEDGSGFIDAEEFVDGCLKLKGNARSIDLAKLGQESRLATGQLASMVHDMSDSVATLAKSVIELKTMGKARVSAYSTSRSIRATSRSETMPQVSLEAVLLETIEADDFETTRTELAWSRNISGESTASLLIEKERISAGLVQDIDYVVREHLSASTTSVLINTEDGEPSGQTTDVKTSCRRQLHDQPDSRSDRVGADCPDDFDGVRECSMEEATSAPPSPINRLQDEIAMFAAKQRTSLIE
eukprot:TRINITY_DN47787_c0_g3_i1.p1 TRINITY_DN47787_c0_g3~~TRINITY_DN47787_c0_g3_i1.p1  ORF type:complete len:737 (-),score=101.73 TRINITY_DN47787_c0_g3_i1:90-2300(-)